jgi:hypothetical protein
MPLGMYSYATDGPFSMMYDLPAVYGLYLKSAAKDPNEEMINVLKAIRTIYFAGSSNGAGIFKKNVEFNSSSNDDQTTHWCGVPAPGNSCNFTEPANESTSTAYCLYPNYARAVANNQSLYLYGCPAEGIKAGTCFPPCLSLRYDQGLIPGGKALDLFGNGGTTPDRIVGDATFNNHLNLNKEKILGPRYTAWAQNTTSLPNDSYKSINPTVGGGSDHCNYVTPTAWIGSTQKVFSNVNYMSTLIDNFA